MKFLAMDTTGANFDEEAVNKHLKEDLTRVWELYSKGFIRKIYQRGGITTFDTVIPIQPFTGFSALFEKN